MKRNGLEQVLRMRRMVLDEAVQNFAECLRKEAEAAGAVRAIEAAIAREAERAGDLDGGDALVEAFGTWFRKARDDLEAAMTVYEEAEADTVRARAVISAARSALEATESVKANQGAEVRRAEEREQQKILDEAAHQHDR